MRLRISQKVAVPVVYGAAMFISLLDTTVVNVALPAIGRSFSVTPTAVDSISISFLVSLAVFMPTSGWLSDRFGGKATFLGAIAVFTVSSVLCGASDSLGELVLFRVLQGAGGGMLAPVGLAMLYRTFPPAERVRVQATLTVPTTMAPTFGPIIGGVLVTGLSWRWVFYLNMPIGLAALLFGSFFLTDGGAQQPGRFDRGGFLLAGLSLGLLMYGISEGPIQGWGGTLTIAAITIGLALLSVLVLVELRAEIPMIDLRLLGNRLFCGMSGVAVLVSAAFLGILFGVTLYFQDGRGLSPLVSGLTIFPEALGVMVGAQVTSRVSFPALGPQRLITGGLLAFTAISGLMALASGGGDLWWMRALLFMLGFTMMQVAIPADTTAFITVRAGHTGRAATLFNVLRQLGGALGVCVFTTVIAAVGQASGVTGHGQPHLVAYRLAFLAAAGISLLAAAMSWVILQDTDAALDVGVVTLQLVRRLAPSAPPSGGMTRAFPAPQIIIVASHCGPAATAETAG